LQAPAVRFDCRKNITMFPGFGRKDANRENKGSPKRLKVFSSLLVTANTPYFVKLANQGFIDILLKGHIFQRGSNNGEQKR
jgi:hypothetical protein